MSRLFTLCLRLLGYGLVALIVASIVLYTTNLFEFRTQLTNAYAEMTNEGPLTADDILLPEHKVLNQR